jgi:hypothetical protein
LRNQTIATVALATKRQDQCEAYMDKMERALKSEGKEVPDKGYRGPPKVNEVSHGQPNRKAPQRTQDGKHHIPRREDRLIKKHQFSNKLSEMSDAEYDTMLSAAMTDPRFKQLFVLDEGAVDEPGMERFFDPAL